MDTFRVREAMVFEVLKISLMHVSCAIMAAKHQMISMMDRLLGVLKRGGPEKLVEKCAPVVPPELRETAFVNACDLVLADGIIEQPERLFIDGLMLKLGVTTERAKQIIQVMAYKNEG